jgi:hypothetical protein
MSPASRRRSLDSGTVVVATIAAAAIARHMPAVLQVARVAATA